MKKKNGKESAVFRGLSINRTRGKRAFFSRGQVFSKTRKCAVHVGFF